MNRYMDTTGQRFSRIERDTIVDATRIERTALDYATWHTRLKGHNDGRGSTANAAGPDTRAA
jgi:hypothetical protein